MASTPHMSAMMQPDWPLSAYPLAISYDSVCMPAIPPRSSKRPKPPELAKLRNKLQKRRRPSDVQDEGNHSGQFFNGNVSNRGPYSNSRRSSLSGFWSFKNSSKGAPKHTTSQITVTQGGTHSRSGSSTTTSSQDLESIWQRLPAIGSRYSASSHGEHSSSPSISISSPSTTFDHAGWHSETTDAYNTDASSVYSSECAKIDGEGNTDLDNIVVSAELIAEQYRNLLLSRASTRASMRTPLPPQPTPAPGYRRSPRPLRPHAPAPKLRRRQSQPNLRRLTITDTEVNDLSTHVSQLTSSLSAAMKMEYTSTGRRESNVQIGLLIEAYEDLQRELRLGKVIDEGDAEEVQALNEVVGEWLEAVGATSSY